MNGKNVLGVINSNDDNTHDFSPPGGVDEIEKFHHGTLDVVYDNFAGASGRRGHFHSLGRIKIMRPKWAFQLLPNTPDVLGKGFRVDPNTQVVEDEVNACLQHKFGFHGISKLVIRLGPTDGEKDYHEGFGVAHKYYPSFDINEYKSLGPKEKICAMRRIVIEILDWLICNFEDAQCFKRAKKDLGWGENLNI